jgi:hypothetical protein
VAVRKMPPCTTFPYTWLQFVRIYYAFHKFRVTDMAYSHCVLRFHRWLWLPRCRQEGQVEYVTSMYELHVRQTLTSCTYF